MKLKIAQSYEYVGNDYWRWRAWLEGAAEDLDEVESVKWLLHPSFTPSVVVSEDRSSKFALDCSGWGTFLLRAEVLRGPDNVLHLRKMLELNYPEPDAPSAPTRAAPPKPAAKSGPKPPIQPRKLFLSYGAEDRKTALQLRSTLESLGHIVLDDSQIQAGQPWELAMRKLMSDADATVAFVSSDTPSTFLASEVKSSVQSGKPTLVIASEDFGEILGLDAGLQIFHARPDDREGIAAALGTLDRAGS